jgi:hypothetical protein
MHLPSWPGRAAAPASGPWLEALINAHWRPGLKPQHAFYPNLSHRMRARLPPPPLPRGACISSQRNPTHCVSLAPAAPTGRCHPRARAPRPRILRRARRCFLPLKLPALKPAHLGRPRTWPGPGPPAGSLLGAGCLTCGFFSSFGGACLSGGLSFFAQGAGAAACMLLPWDRHEDCDIAFVQL